MVTSLDRDQWQKLKGILADALEEPSLQRRLETLRTACAHDIRLLKTAEALLNEDTTVLEDFAELAVSCLRDGRTSRAATVASCP